MDFITIFLIAIGLSMDSVAVCISNGICMKLFCLHKSLKMAMVMGGFQGGMLWLGWALGKHFSSYISEFDHWIAFGLLAYIGGKMVYDSFQKEEKRKFNTFSNRILLTLGIATSIDALAVGVSLALFEINIWFPTCIVACTTFILSLMGVFFGFYFNRIRGLRVELIGGIILIAIGIKILAEHTLTYHA